MSFHPFLRGFLYGFILSHTVLSDGRGAEAIICAAGIGHGLGDVMSMDFFKSACTKFLEIVMLSFLLRGQPRAGAGRVRRHHAASSDDFALEDLPVGHLIITRQALEEIGEEAFTVLRGLMMIEGQVKVDSGQCGHVRVISETGGV